MPIEIPEIQQLISFLENEKTWEICTLSLILSTQASRIASTFKDKQCQSAHAHDILYRTQFRLYNRRKL